MLSLVGLTACRRQPHLSAQELYRSEQSKFQRGELPMALADADAGLNAFTKDTEWAWRFRVAKAEVLVWQGKAKDALAVLQSEVPPTLASSDIAVRSWIVRGIADYQLQRLDESAIALAKAEELASANQRELIGDVDVAWGSLAVRQRDFEKAKQLYLTALSEGRRKNDVFLEGSALGNIGVLNLRQERYAEALDWFAQSLNTSERLGNRTQRAMTLGNMGWCRFKLGDYEQALELFDQGVALASELGIERIQVLWLTNIGNVHHEKHEYAEAIANFKRALGIARKLEDKSSTAIALSNLAASAIEMRDFETAENYNREALEIKRALGDKSSELYSSLNAARIAAGRNDRATAIKLLDTIAKNAGDNVSLKWEVQAELGNQYAAAHDQVRADRQFRTALATIDAARAGLKKEEYRLSFLTSASRFYNDYIDFLVASGRTGQALKVAEHSRARTLAEGLGLKADAIDASFNPSAVASKQKAVLLYYWLAPKGSYLWAVSPKKTELFRLPPDSEIVRKVEEYRKSLMGPRDVRETASAAGQELYTMLVGPARKSLATNARVIVIADGPLHGLNFETLLVPGTQPHYWIEDAVITNVNSIALLAAPRHGHAPQQKNLLLIGNPRYTGQEFAPLKQAPQEVTRVESHFAPELRMVLAEDQAKASAYMGTKAAAYRYIHFVAHATASRVSPLDSSIILTKDGENAKLYARDIMQQPLSAELVTISACNGSGTRAYSGEGLVGLSWAFLRAGAHNVIAALWEVNDASTPQLMDTLYSEMGKGKDAATALRAAKLQMLHSDSVYRRPFYWAAFQLYSGS